MPLSGIERLLRRLSAPVLWLPPVLAGAAAITFGRTFGVAGVLVGLPVGTALGVGLGLLWDRIVAAPRARQERFAGPVAEAVANDPAPAPKRRRDAREVATEAWALLEAGRPGEASVLAGEAIQMAVLADELEIALETWITFERHRARIALEPSTRARLDEAEAQRRRGRSG